MTPHDKLLSWVFDRHQAITALPDYRDPAHQSARIAWVKETAESLNELRKTLLDDKRA